MNRMNDVHQSKCVFFFLPHSEHRIHFENSKDWVKIFAPRSYCVRIVEKIWWDFFRCICSNPWAESATSWCLGFFKNTINDHFFTRPYLVRSWGDQKTKVSVRRVKNRVIYIRRAWVYSREYERRWRTLRCEGITLGRFTSRCFKLSQAALINNVGAISFRMIICETREIFITTWASLSLLPFSCAPLSSLFLDTQNSMATERIQVLETRASWITARLYMHVSFVFL